MAISILATDSRKSAQIIAARLLLAILPLGMLYITKLWIDRITAHSFDMTGLWPMLMALGGLMILQLLISQWSSLMEAELQQKTSDHFTQRIIEATSKLDYARMEDPQFQNTLYLAQQQSRHRINQLLPAIYGVIGNLLSLALLVLFFIGLKAYLFLLVFLLAIPITINKWIQGKKMADLDFALSPTEREANYFFRVTTGLPWAKELRLFGFGKAFAQKHDELRKNIATQKKDNLQKSFWRNLMAEGLEIVGVLVILGSLGVSTLQGSLSAGLFVVYVQGLQRLQSTSKGFFQSVLQIFQLRDFLRDLMVFLELKPTKVKSVGAIKPAIQSLELQHVSFHYPQQKHDVLTDINLQAKKGEVIAIVGENGSGKSTLVKLLAGLYQPENGEILIDKIRLANLNPEDWQSKSAFLFQDFEKYALSVSANIHFKPDALEQELENVRNAAIRADADGFINRLAEGYQTRLGNLFKGSAQPSGGQWQKLALARIFFRNADLVVLDEPSSALDAFSEQQLYDTISTHFKNSIVIIISHRLYNLKMTDRIYVLSEGSVVQEGNFDALIAKEGMFRSMYERQRI